jgi:uncharacterized protein YbaR (Trm112 family)/SAM-dependent methyltransferase
MQLFDILACPKCHADLEQRPDTLYCQTCSQSYPIIKGVPVLFVDGRKPDVVHEAALTTRRSYDPWIHRMILQSLLDDQIVLELGSGSQTLDDPCIIRMDIFLSPHVDVVADAHHLPFKKGSIDFTFSLAVFEHLRQPFQAAKEIYRVLKDGGLAYHECNFIFAYHGYPHHYFNASLQGLSQVFKDFELLKKGVAPYQMPSFALRSVLEGYLNNSKMREFAPLRLYRKCRQILDEDLTQYDIYFDTECAAKAAAGVYFAGYKNESEHASLIPKPVLKIYHDHPQLKARFPECNDLTTKDNLLLWAKGEGAQRYPEIRSYLDSIEVFNKRDPASHFDRTPLRELPLVEPIPGKIGADPNLSMQDQALQQRNPALYWIDHLLFKMQRGWHFLRTHTFQQILRALFNPEKK